MAVDLTQPIKLGSPDYVEQQVIRKLDALGTSVTDPALEARVAQNESDIADLEIADTALDARLDAIEADYTTEAEADARVVTVASGREELWIPAEIIRPAAFGPFWNACAALATFKIADYTSMASYLAFDGATVETALANIAMPKRWNKGTVTFQPYWRPSTTATGTVWWGLGARALSDSDLNGTFSVVYSVDTANGTAYDLHIGPESAAVTVLGSPANGDLIQFLFLREAGSDTNGADAWLEGYKIFWTSEAPTDD